MFPALLEATPVEADCGAAGGTRVNHVQTALQAKRDEKAAEHPSEQEDDYGERDGQAADRVLEAGHDGGVTVLTHDEGRSLPVVADRAGHRAGCLNQDHM